MARSKDKNNVSEMDDHALVTGLADAKQELFNLRFRHVTGQLENTSRLSAVRRQIAQINTELRAREIAAAEALMNEGKA